MNDDLAGRVSGLAARVKDLTDATRRNRQVLKLLAASLVFDVVLSFGVGFVLLRVRQEGCRATNRANAASYTLWNRTLALRPTRAETADEKARRAAFKTYLDEAFKPNAC